MSESERDRDPVDVEALMADLRGRVADKKARGLYSVDALTIDAIEQSGDDGDRIEVLRRLAVQRVDLEPWPSTKPVAGPLIRAAKSALTRGVSRSMFSMADQSNAFNAALLAHLATISREVESLRLQLEEARREIDELRERAETDEGTGGRGAHGGG